MGCPSTTQPQVPALHPLHLGFFSFDPIHCVLTQLRAVHTKGSSGKGGVAGDEQSLATAGSVPQPWAGM